MNREKVSNAHTISKTTVKLFNEMKVRIKRLCPEARIPEYAHPGDAGMDLYAASISEDEMCNIVYGTGISV